VKKLLLFGLLLLVACKDIGGRVPSKEELLKKEMQSIDWKSVDEYPSVAACDSLPDKEQRRNCFFDFIRQTIQERLNADTLPADYPAPDTLRVTVTIFPDAHVGFACADAQWVACDSLIHARLADFPSVNPALKRGLPVKTEFVLPVVLKAD
jgi:hypothetical protein